MRVSFVVVGTSPWQRPARHDGGFPFAQAVAGRLGGDYHVVVPAAPGGAGVESHGALHVHWLAAGGRGSLLRAARREVAAILGGLTGDVVLSASDPAAFLALAGRRRPGRALLVQVQGEVLEPGSEYGSRAKRLAITAVTRWAVRRADVVRVVNTDLGAAVARFARGPVRVVGTRVDTTRFRPSASGARRDVVMIGSLIPLKNHATVLRAWSALRGRRAGHLLHLLGDGPERRRLEQLAGELGVASEVRFLGRRGSDEVATLLSRSWTLAHPSLTEGQPRAVLEALASGVTVLASDIPAHRELALEAAGAGRLVPASDGSAWEQALAEVCQEDPALHQHGGAAARALAVERFDLQVNADQFSALVRETLAVHRQ